jgi:catechol 2,3-dioxygenase-like lactoylglutathione lyase family enzyme
MIDHLGIRVRDYAAARKFYEAALAPIGYKQIFEIKESDGFGYVGVGYGEERPDFWIGVGEAGGPLHFAFAVKSRATVDAFYKAAIAAGAKDNGAPGPRPHYHQHYYGAFVLDLDGNNLEVVCHIPA